MKNFYDFLAMGVYGGYVWSAYGIVFVVLIYHLMTALRRKK